MKRYISIVVVCKNILTKNTGKTQAKKKDVPFYQGVIKSLEFYAQTILPITLDRFAALLGTSAVAVEIEDNMFPC